MKLLYNLEFKNQQHCKDSQVKCTKNPADKKAIRSLLVSLTGDAVGERIFYGEEVDFHSTKWGGKREDWIPVDFYPWES